MKFSKKIIAALLCMLILVGNFALVGSAQVESSGSVSQSNVIKDVNDLQDGKIYRIRSAATGKYMTINQTAYQYDRYEDKNKTAQEFYFRKDENNVCRLENSFSFTNIRGFYGAYTWFIMAAWSPSTSNDGWIIENGYLDGTMSIHNATMKMDSKPFYVTADGDENGDDLTYRGVCGNIILDPSYTLGPRDATQLWYFEEVVEKEEGSERPVLGSGFYTFDMSGLSPYFQFDGDWVFNGAEIRPQATGDTCTFSFYGDGLNIIYDLPYGMLELNIDGQGWNLIDTFVSGYNFSIDNLAKGLHTVAIRYPGIESSNPMSYGSTDFVITAIEIY